MTKNFLNRKKIKKNSKMKKRFLWQLNFFQIVYQTHTEIGEISEPSIFVLCSSLYLSLSLSSHSHFFKSLTNIWFFFLQIWQTWIDLTKKFWNIKFKNIILITYAKQSYYIFEQKRKKKNETKEKILKISPPWKKYLRLLAFNIMQNGDQSFFFVHISEFFGGI